MASPLICQFHDDYQRGAAFKLGPFLLQVTITRRLSLYIAIGKASALFTL